MAPGDQLRFRGPAGAPFVVTVGVAFSPEYIAAQVASGDWAPIEEPTPEKPEASASKRTTTRRKASA